MNRTFKLIIREFFDTVHGIYNEYGNCRTHYITAILSILSMSGHTKTDIVSTIILK